MYFEPFVLLKALLTLLAIPLIIAYIVRAIVVFKWMQDWGQPNTALALIPVAQHLEFAVMLDHINVIEGDEYFTKLRFVGNHVVTYLTYVAASWLSLYLSIFPIPAILFLIGMILLFVVWNIYDFIIIWRVIKYYSYSDNLLKALLFKFVPILGPYLCTLLMRND